MDWITSAIIAVGIVGACFVVAWGFVPKGWRTVAFNLLSGASAIVGPLLEYSAHVPWHEAFDPRTAFFIVLLVNFANILWRWKTTTPLGARS